MRDREQVEADMLKSYEAWMRFGQPKDWRELQTLRAELAAIKQKENEG